jgi:hypothetical protein
MHHLLLLLLMGTGGGGKGKGSCQNLIQLCLFQWANVVLKKLLKEGKTLPKDGNWGRKKLKRIGGEFT